METWEILIFRFWFFVNPVCVAPQFDNRYLKTEKIYDKFHMNFVLRAEMRRNI